MSNRKKPKVEPVFDDSYGHSLVETEITGGTHAIDGFRMGSEVGSDLVTMTWDRYGRLYVVMENGDLVPASEVLPTRVQVRRNGKWKRPAWRPRKKREAA